MTQKPWPSRRRLALASSPNHRTTRMLNWRSVTDALAAACSASSRRATARHAISPKGGANGSRVCAVVVSGVARSNAWRLRIAAKSPIASGAPLRFWGGGLGVLLALGVWYSTAGASVTLSRSSLLTLSRSRTTEKFLGSECDIEKSEPDIQKI